MICYFDCFSGISGDMVLGALVHAGVSPDRLRKELSRLRIRGYDLTVKKVKRAGISATKVDVVLKPKVRGQKPEGRQWKDIEQLIQNSKLSDHIKRQGLRVFKALFQAEARVHGKKYNEIHLHELGAVDCLVDIFGALIGLDILGIEKIYSSPLNLGSGIVKTEHGVLPVPAPATAELLKDIPVYSSGARFELTTPTGAVLLSALSDRYGSIPSMQVSTIGIGAGNKNLKEHPNVLRLFIGQKTDHSAQNPLSHPFSKGGKGGIHDRVTVIETNIDDMNPQVYEFVAEKLFEAGALDVYLTQIIMKKGRPGIKLTVLCAHERRTELSALLFRETSSIGIRFYEVQRNILDRESKKVATKFGKIHVKVSRLGKEAVQITPEYEDCRKAAKKHNVPLLEVMQSVTSSGPTVRRGKKK